MSNKSHRFEAIFIKLILLVFSILGLNWIYNYLFDVKENQPPLGLCEENNRVITPDEIILAALESKYKYNAIKTEDSTETAQEFYNKYPFCCDFGPPSASYPRRNPFTGELYIKDPGYVVVTLYYPTDDEVLGNSKRFNCESLNLNEEDCLKHYNVEEGLIYTKSNVPVSNCGGIGSATHKDLNIKDTPYGNEVMRAQYMQDYEWLRSGSDWRKVSRAQDWESWEHYNAGDKDWEYSEHAKF